MTRSFNEDIPAALSQVQTRPLFVMRLEVAPLLNVGAAPAGERRVAVVSGGAFRGERLSGSVLDGGSDWLTLRPDGATTLDVRVVLKTDDDALIGMTYGGFRHGPPEIMQRLARGESVDPSQYYFRMTPRFETSAPKYDWLNRIVAVGLGHRRPDGPLYSVFEVL
jgi:hypothetical protein